jgi:hypothetical protein
MSRVKDLSDYLSLKGNLATVNLLSYPIYISEKLSSCNFYVQKGESEILFFKGDGKKRINQIDRTLNRLYEEGIDYVQSNTSIYTELPDNWKFAFDYFPTSSPANVEYEIIPESKLVLSRILVVNESGKTSKVIDDPTVLKEWAGKFKTEFANSVFHGNLDRKRAENIVEALQISGDFAIENIFNAFAAKPQLGKSIKSEIDSLLIRVYEKRGKKPSIFKISSDKITEALNESKSYFPHDSTAILVLDFLDFINGRSLAAESLVSKKPDERYVELISYLYEKYIQKRRNSVEEMNFETGEFATDEVFELNSEMIRNPDLYTSLKESSNLSKAFQIILNSFRTKKNESANPLFTPFMIETHNQIVERIKKITESVPDKDFMTFGDYLKLKELNESMYSNEPDVIRVKQVEKEIGNIKEIELISESSVDETIEEENASIDSDEEYIKKQESDEAENL